MILPNDTTFEKAFTLQLCTYSKNVYPGIQAQIANDVLDTGIQ